MTPMTLIVAGPAGACDARCDRRGRPVPGPVELAAARTRRCATAPRPRSTRSGAWSAVARCDAAATRRDARAPSRSSSDAGRSKTATASAPSWSSSARSGSPARPQRSAPTDTSAAASCASDRHASDARSSSLAATQRRHHRCAVAGETELSAAAARNEHPLSIKRTNCKRPASPSLHLRSSTSGLLRQGQSSLTAPSVGGRTSPSTVHYVPAEGRPAGALRRSNACIVRSSPSARATSARHPSAARCRARVEGGALDLAGPLGLEAGLEPEQPRELVDGRLHPGPDVVGAGEVRLRRSAAVRPRCRRRRRSRGSARRRRTPSRCARRWRPRFRRWR